MRRPSASLLVSSLLLALGAALMPSGWYDTLPLPPLPLSGVVLLRCILAIEALVVAAFAFAGWRYTTVDPGARLGALDREESAYDVSQRTAQRALLAITLLAAALRFFRANSDLWIDEISPILDYAGMPVAQIVGRYLASNNHLLYTLLLKLSLAVFGDHEWSVRLPAITFGILTVPALYWCARAALSRRASLGACLLLAASYHHIFFSQNARGYSAYMLFAILATRFLVDGLKHDRLRDWAGYVATVLLGFASLLNTVFVLAAHVVVGVIALLVLRRRGAPVWPLTARLFSVFALAGLLSLQLYSVALPEVYVVITSVYSRPSTGFSGVSLEFAREMIRGVTVGFGSGAMLAAIPFLAAASVGVFRLLRRNWVLTLGLGLPGALTATFLLVRSLSFSPRFFLLWLPLAIVTVVAAIEDGVAFFARKRGHTPSATRRLLAAGTVAVIVLAIVSIASLRRYYTVPKQPYREALAEVERIRRPDDIVIVIYTAKNGVQYYGSRMKLPLDSRYRFARTIPEFDSAIAARKGGGRVILLVTFERALRLDLPELYQRVNRGWEQSRSFPATVNDGSLAIWRERGVAHDGAVSPGGGASAGES